MSPRLCSVEEALRTPRAARRARRASRATRTRPASSRVGRDARHPQLAHRRPQRLRHRRLIGERPEVAALLRQVEQQPHHQRRAEPLFGRIDAALDEERRAHAERDVERRDEAQVDPVGALEGEPLAERAADRVRRHEDPLRARGMGRAETFQLVDKWIHVEAAGDAGRSGSTDGSTDE